MTIRDLYDQAELALAAYANLFAGISGGDYVRALEIADMSSSQAAQFSERWLVLDQYTHTELIPVLDEFNQPTGEYTTSSNGLSVTVFQRVGTNEKYVAVRGTEFSTADFTADGGVFLHGVPSLSTQYQTLREQILFWQSNYPILNGSFTVCGHSLGGWLAAGLAGEFRANVTQGYLYNAPGVRGWRGSVEDLFRGALGRTSAIPTALNVTTIRATSGASLIAGLGVPVSPPFGVEIEAAPFPYVGNHSIVRLTDALAVHAAYAELAPALTLAQTGQILRSASERNTNSLEAMLDALRTTLLGAAVVPTTTEDRDALYRNLKALQDSAEYRVLAGGATLRVTATLGRDELVTNAKTDFGHFLAVKYLLPVAIEGAWGVLGTIHVALYTQWQADRTNRAAGNIDLNYTNEYLADRSAFLTWKNHLALRDRSAAAAPYTDAPDAWFRDYATSLTIHLGATLTDSTAKPRYLFGADQASGTEMLEGGTNADRIYGGGGADHLYGHGGRDHLEGGAGDDRLYGGDQDDTLIGGEGSDRLEGGKGFDTYIVGQGTDTIVDEDGLGVVKDGQGRILAGAFIQGADGRYSWAGNPAVTATHNSPLTITLENGAQVVIDNYDAFAEGELGIELIAAPTPLTPGRTILGDLEPIDTDPTEPGVQTASDELGNLLVSGEAPGRADHLYDSAGADLIQSGGGNDTVHASRGGADRIEAGAGRDSVAAGAGDDLVLGGTEADILEGQAGADRLYADAETSTAEALTLGLSQTASGRQGDWINGGAGDDLLVAGLDNDALFGGAGADRQVGGASIGVMFEGSKIRNRRFGKSQSPQHGDKSRTAWDGEQTAANDIERRIAA